VAKKREELSGAQMFLAVVGVIAWIIAGLFATQDAVKSVEKSTGVAMAPNNLGAAAILGFALAGGLCFLGVGIAERHRDRDSGTPPTPPAPPRAEGPA
jgi:hypothetical protein